jgi:hypothetical protein
MQCFLMHGLLLYKIAAVNLHPKFRFSMLEILVNRRNPTAFPLSSTLAGSSTG